MECRKAAAAAVEEERLRMVACELEAAEALARMAHCSAAPSFVEQRPQHSVEAVVTYQEPPVAAEPAMSASLDKAEKIVEHMPTNLCSTSRPSNPPMKFKRKLTEAEREERKLRRVMANRESARQTIRRRQAMHLELTKKADDVLQENENLKKQKELMVEEYSTLKGRNDYLKAQLAGVKKVAGGDTSEERNSSEAERFCSATASTQVLLHNEPSIVHCFWPSIIPSPDAFPFQYASSHLHNMSSSRFVMPPGDMMPYLHQGEEHSTGNPRPLYIVPVPWLLPLLSHSSSSGGTQTHHCRKCSCAGANPSDDNSQNMSTEEAYNHMEAVNADSEGRAGTSLRRTPSTMVVPGMFSPVRPRETVVEPSTSCHADDSADLRLASAFETVRHGLSNSHPPSWANKEAIICSPKKAEDVFVATEARRRRKELMKLKNLHCK